MSEWYYELQEDGLRIGLEYDEHLVDKQSPFQKVDVYRTRLLGNLLTLDGLVMTTQKDEFFYHEMISHPALFTHPDPRRTLIIGGGDGGALREVLKHDRVREGHLCEIDKMVCDESRIHFPELARSFDHPRAKLFIEDGFKFLDDHRDAYEVILVDSTDPIGEAAKLFEESFLRKVHRSLTADGITVMQCENPFLKIDVMKKMYDSMKPLFAHVAFYFCPIPTYPSGYWAFLMGSKKHHPVRDFGEKAWQDKTFSTKYYNADIHRAAFALPQYVKEALGA